MILVKPQSFKFVSNINDYSEKFCVFQSFLLLISVLILVGDEYWRLVLLVGTIVKISLDNARFHQHDSLSLVS